MAIQYFMIALIMLFAAGLSLKWLGVGVGLGIVSIPILWNFVLQDYQITRILVLFDPSIDLDASRQATYGKIAIGSGQLTGQGLTHGTMTPDAAGFGKPDRLYLLGCGRGARLYRLHGDHLPAYAADYAAILRLLPRLNHVFRLLAVGVGGMFLFQTFMNIFMNIGLLRLWG